MKILLGISGSSSTHLGLKLLKIWKINASFIVLLLKVQR